MMLLYVLSYITIAILVNGMFLGPGSDIGDNNDTFLMFITVLWPLSIVVFVAVLIWLAVFKLGTKLGGIIEYFLDKTGIA